MVITQRETGPHQSAWDAMKIVFVCAAVALNSLSKLSPVVYAPLLGAAFLIMGMDLLRRSFRLERDSINGIVLLLLYLAFTAASFLLSVGTISSLGALIGLGRYLFAIPILFAFLLYVRDFRTLKLAVVGISIFVALGNLSVPWQMAFGEVSWLDSDYKRGGFDRYASILGNVTAIGISAGFYFAIVLVLMPPGLWKILISVAIIVSAIASLSKAAIFNLAIPVVGLIGLAFFTRFRVIAKLPFTTILGSILLVGSVISIALFVPSVRGRVLVSLASFGVSGSDELRTDDVDVATSFQERLLQHPVRVLNNLDKVMGPVGHLTGAGFGMSSTALVPQADELSTMAHNQLAEFWALGGVFYLVLFIVFLIYVLYRIIFLINYCYSARLDQERRFFVCMLVVMICYLANLPFANGLTYQPTQATIFWLFFALIILPKTVLLRQVNHGHDQVIVS